MKQETSSQAVDLENLHSTAEIQTKSAQELTELYQSILPYEDEDKYYFQNVDYLAYYLKRRSEAIPDGLPLTSTKLQKCLYILWANYAAHFGAQRFIYRDLSDVEDYQDYIGRVYTDFQKNGELWPPEQLFPAEFEAWSTGPVIRSVYIKCREKYYDKAPEGYDEEQLFSQGKHLYNPEIKKFIDYYFDQILSQMPDFFLITQVKEDRAWRDVYGDGRREVGVIDCNEILREYVARHIS